MSKIRSRLELGVTLPPTNIEGENGQDLTVEGEIAVDSSDSKLKVRLESETRSVVTEDQAQTLESKTIDADNNIISNLEVDNLKTGVLNTSSTLDSATDSQIPSAKAVKDYVDSSSGEVQTDVDDLITLSGVPANSTDLGTFTGSIIQDDSTIKEAFQDLETFAELLEGSVEGTDGLVQDLITLSGVPSASEDLGSFTGSTIPDESTVKEALQVLETQVELKADDSDLTAHTSASTNVHGIGADSSVVGTDTVQTLTNKTLTSPVVNNGSITGTSITNPARAGVKEDTFDNLVTYAATATDGQIVFATDSKRMYQVVDGALQDIGGGGKSLDTLLQLTADEPLSDWTFLNDDLSISKVDPLFGDASYELKMEEFAEATYKVMPVDIGFRGTTIALTLNYLMPQGAARVELLDQDNNLIDGATFDIPAANGKEKFGTTVFIPSDVTGIRFKAESTATVSGQVFKFDNVELSADLLKSVDIGDKWQTLRVANVSSGTINLATGVKGGNSSLFSVSGGVITILSDCEITVSVYSNATSTGNGQYHNILISGDLTAQDGEVSSTTGSVYRVSTSTSSALKENDSVTLSINSSMGTIIHGYSILATARTPSIVAPTDQVTERSIAFRWRSPAQATEANLSATGLIGDYVTGQYAANTNTLTQCTTRPTQTDADMSVNGLRIYTRAYNAASTAALPTRFVIKIAEPNQMAACDVSVFKDVSRLIRGGVSYAIFDTGAKGFYNEEFFNPSTGLLTIDAGVTEATNITGHVIAFSDNTGQTNGYICFTASKLAQGVAIPTRKPYARYVNNTGQLLPSDATTTITNWTKIADTHDFMNPTTGIITIPENGVYLINANFRVDQGGFSGKWLMQTSLINNTSEQIELAGSVSTLHVSPASYTVITTELSGITSLTKGTKLRIGVSQESGGSRNLYVASPGTENNDNSFSIVKIGDL